MKKRYQYFSKEGVKWTEWFNHNGIQTPWQLQPKLRNEYKQDSTNN